MDRLARAPVLLVSLLLDWTVQPFWPVVELFMHVCVFLQWGAAGAEIKSHLLRTQSL